MVLDTEDMVEVLDKVLVEDKEDKAWAGATLKRTRGSES